MYKSEAFFFGVTRFSVYFPKSAAWKISSQLTEAEYLAQLYADERLTPRFDIFLNRALPIYKKFSDSYRYRHIVLYSEELPDKWKKALFDVKDKYPFIILHKVEGLIDYKPLIREEVSNNTHSDRVVAVFRVDDDDLLSEDYIEQLSSYAKFEFFGMSISFSLGIAAKYFQGSYSDFRIIREHLMSQGQATIGKYIYKDNSIHIPKSVSHAKTDLYRPVIIDSRTPAFVQTFHGSQDTRATGSGRSDVSVIDKELSKRKAVDDYDKFIRPFPTIADDFLWVRSERNILLDSKESKLDGKEIHYKLDLSKKGSYRASYRLFFDDSVLNDSRGLLFCIGEQSDQVGEVIGMNTSKRANIGWFKYVPIKRGVVENSFEFFITENSNIDSLYLKNWNYKGAAEVESIVVEKIG